jgi:hypothetical protein
MGTEEISPGISTSSFGPAEIPFSEIKKERKLGEGYFGEVWLGKKEFFD